MDKIVNAKESYNSMAELYVKKNESNLYNNYYERPATISLIPEISGKRVFDAGCGGGTLLEWLVNHNANIIGCDISEELIKYSKNRLPEYSENIFLADLSDGIDFIDNNSVDGIVSSLVIHYIDDWYSLFNEFNRILKKNGFIVLSTHHPLVDWKWAEMDNYFEKKINEEVWKIGEHHQKVRFYHRTLTELFATFSKTGFYVEKLLEPKPLDEGKFVDVKSFDYLNKNPHFIFIRLKKIERE